MKRRPSYRTVIYIIKKRFFRFLMSVIMSFAFVDYAISAETIKILSPYSASHSGTPALLKLIDQANASQQIYKFILEFKPGGNQIIAVKSIEPENSLAVIAPAFVDNVATGKLDANDYVPVWALGDACWAVITNKPLTRTTEFTVGGVGVGNASHLTALALGEKYNFKVQYIVFKSNNDALINMTGNNGVEMVIDRYESYQNLRSKNSNLRMVAASCPSRLRQEPKIKTLAEQGVSAPYIFNIIIAHKNMPLARQKAISNILTNIANDIGVDEFYKLSAMRPPQFDGIGVVEYYQKSLSQVSGLQKKFKTSLDDR